MMKLLSYQNIKMTLLRCVGVVAMIILVGAVKERQRAEPGMLMPDFFPPSVPLVVVNPYLSVWSASDNLYDDITTHWSGSPMKLAGMITIDNRTYRYMSKEDSLPSDTMEQVNLTIYPTQTVYVFQTYEVQLTLTFSTPALTNTGKVPTLPMTILTYKVESLDGKSHHVKLYYDNTGEGTVDSKEEIVVFFKLKDDSDGEVLRAVHSAWAPLSETGNLINWGYWYVYTPKIKGVQTTVGPGSGIRQAFVDGKELPPLNWYYDESESGPVIAVAWDLGEVTSTEVYLEILYDELENINYFGTDMIPLWKHYYTNITDLMTTDIYNAVKKDCTALDNELINDLYAKGGSEYATLASVAWRQAVGATQSVWNDKIKDHWMFMKEISSDGDISTVDVLYPASPLFLYKSPDSLKRMLIPLLEYASNKAGSYGEDIQYNLPWAPHHLGTWPICNLFEFQQEQMPIEESGNMICMIAGIVNRTEGDMAFIKPYWKLLKKWADYLVENLPDPGNQLCTDDFEGASPHNTNLALKGIVALGAYSYLLKLNNQTQDAKMYDQYVKGYVQYWMLNAKDGGQDGGHFRLQYNMSNSWSMQYNLLFQVVLDLDVFPKSMIMEEEAFYQTKMETFGVPLDSRNSFTKCDWMMWIAAIGNDDQFQALTKALYMFAVSTPDRVPFTDWYYTDTARQRGFEARPVVGGFFAKMIVN